MARVSKPSEFKTALVIRLRDNGIMIQADWRKYVPARGSANKKVPMPVPTLTKIGKSKKLIKSVNFIQLLICFDIVTVSPCFAADESSGTSAVAIELITACGTDKRGSVMPTIIPKWAIASEFVHPASIKRMGTIMAIMGRARVIMHLTAVIGAADLRIGNVG